MRVVRSIVTAVLVLCCAAAGAAAVAASEDVEWIADKRGGKVANPFPRPGESITWSGECKNGFAHGEGELQWFVQGKPDDRYQGNLALGWAEGQGVQTKADGTKYEGNWKPSRSLDRPGLHTLDEWVLRGESAETWTQRFQIQNFLRRVTSPPSPAAMMADFKGPLDKRCPGIDWRSIRSAEGRLCPRPSSRSAAPSSRATIWCGSSLATHHPRRFPLHLLAYPFSRLLHTPPTTHVTQPHPKHRQNQNDTAVAQTQ